MKTYSFQAKKQDHTIGPKTWIMGVLNVTPDSFYDGGAHANPEEAVEHGLRLEADGANIIDIGGESTRPNSDPVPAEVEKARVLPVVSALRKRTSCLLSIDTCKAEVAEASLDAGADIINDVSAFRHDIKVLEIASRYQAGLVLMHMQGTPRTMQLSPFYDNVLSEVKAFLKERLDYAVAFGIPRERIILDPGIGFGKRLEDNLSLINNIAAFRELGRPILIGPSRKSFIGAILDLPPAERMEGTIASAVLSVVRGVSILRVHDVREIRRAILVTEAILNETQNSPPIVGSTSRYVH